MRYRDPTRETAGDARRDLLDAAVVLGAHVDAPEGVVDDEIIGPSTVRVHGRTRALPRIARRA